MPLAVPAVRRSALPPPVLGQSSYAPTLGPRRNADRSQRTPDAYTGEIFTRREFLPYVRPVHGLFLLVVEPFHGLVSCLHT